MNPGPQNTYLNILVSYSLVGGCLNGKRLLTPVIGLHVTGAYYETTIYIRCPATENRPIRLGQ